MGYESILAYGENVGIEFFNGSGYACHAETSALKGFRRTRKGPQRERGSRNRIKDIDILVIRTSRAGNLCNSKPCFKCIQHLSNIKGCRVNNIIYSVPDDIKITSLNKLRVEAAHIPKWFRKPAESSSGSVWDKYKNDRQKYK